MRRCRCPLSVVFPPCVLRRSGLRAWSQPRPEGPHACWAQVRDFPWDTADAPAPHIYRWLLQRIGGSEVPFPVLRNAADGTVPPSDRTRRVALLYDLLFAESPAVHPRYSVTSVYSPVVAQSHLSAKAAGPAPHFAGTWSGSERAVLGMVAEGWTVAGLETLAFGVAQCLREALCECRNVPPPQGRPYTEQTKRGRVRGWGKGKQKPNSHFAGTLFFGAHNVPLPRVAQYCDPWTLTSCFIPFPVWVRRVSISHRTPAGPLLL